MSKIIIRFIEQKDRAECITMLDEFFGTDAVSHQVPTSFHENTVGLALSHSPFVKIIVCMLNDQYAGLCTLSFSYATEMGGHVALIEDIYIRNEFQGSGLGTALFNFIRKEFDDKVKRYRLEVEKNNQKAIKLYERLGFNKLSYEQMVIEHIT